MRSDSPLYNYHAKQLEELIDSYPLEFPDQLRSDLRREVWSTKLRMNGMLASMVGCVTGAIFCRGKAWYVLTGRNILPALYYILGISTRSVSMTTIFRPYSCGFLPTIIILKGSMRSTILGPRATFFEGNIISLLFTILLLWSFDI